MSGSAFLVISLTLVFVVLLNWFLIWLARSSARDANIMRRAVKSGSKPFEKDEAQLQELSRLVEGLAKDSTKEE